MDLINIRVVFFLPLLLIMIQQQVAGEIDGERRWSKMKHTTDDHSNKENDVDGSNINIAATTGKANDVLRLHSMDMDSQDQKNGGERIHVVPRVHHDHHTHMMMRSTDSPSSAVAFLKPEDLKIGKTMLLYFPKTLFSSSRFLPKEVADEIPFSSKQLPTILHYFSIPQDSPRAAAIEDTLRKCEGKPIEGETRVCATSMASMLDSVKHIFGNDERKKIQFLSTIYKTNLTAELQKYTITEVPKETSPPKMVTCHTMPYPYGVLFCHHVEKSKLYKVELVSLEHGDEVEAIVVCHMDTSQWGPNHISFRVLGIEPGTQPVCHFFPPDKNFLLLPSL